VNISPAAFLVLIIVGGIALMVAAGAVWGDLHETPLRNETLMIGTTALGIVGGVLAKTTLDQRQSTKDEPQQVEVVSPASEPVLTEDV
jgi:hypothetical protein